MFSQQVTIALMTRSAFNFTPGFNKVLYDCYTESVKTCGNDIVAFLRGCDLFDTLNTIARKIAR